MKILITGGKGMLGRTLKRRLESANSIFVADLPECDILDSASLHAAFDAFQPDAVLHCAAMVNVDRCESEKETAFRLNETGSANVAQACKRCGARLIAISTDYVFDGAKSEAYTEDDACHPMTVYGASKLAGERAVFSQLPDAVVLRIAWLYGRGGPSFVHTMAGLGSIDGEALKVVDDQRGNPTSAESVADAVEFILAHPEIRGAVHGTCDGVCSWYGFASELFRLLGLKRVLVPCTTQQFPRPAPRPANSALEKGVLKAAGFKPKFWKDALREFVAEEFAP